MIQIGSVIPIIMGLFIGGLIGSLVTYMYMYDQQNVNQQEQKILNFIKTMKSKEKKSFDKTKAIQEFARECLQYDPGAFKKVDMDVFKRVIELLWKDSYPYISSSEYVASDIPVYISDETLLEEIEKALKKLIDV